MPSGIANRTSFAACLRNALKRGITLRFWWYRFKWNVFPALRLVSGQPLHVDIEVTDACNLRCSMCVHGTQGVPDAGFIESGLAYKAIDECGRLGVYSVKFNFRGEPLLHPQLVDFVRRAKEAGIIEVQFNTNGLPTDAKKIESLIRAGLDRIIFSVDGATKESYERIRKGATFEKLVENIRLFIALKKKLRHTRPFIRVQMVVDDGNRHEVNRFIAFWKHEGVDNIAVIEKQDRSKTSGNPLRQGREPVGRGFCEQPWQRLNINRDGKVLICCGDWNRKTVVGDFSVQTIAELWRGEKFQDCRSKIRKGRLDDIPACSSCFRPATYKWK